MRPEEEARIRERADAHVYTTAAWVKGAVLDTLELARADRRVLLLEVDMLRLQLRVKRTGNEWRSFLEQTDGR